jgi:hypothetical protein
MTHGHVMKAWLDRLFCAIGWHCPAHRRVILGFDGCSVHARCPWCGFEGMIDSQGNLF